MPGMTPEVLNGFLKQRQSLPRDQKAVAAALGPAKGAAVPETQAFRVLTALRFDNGRRTASEAVILLAGTGSKDSSKGKGQNVKDGGKDPYSVLLWQDEVETGSRQFKQANR